MSQFDLVLLQARKQDLQLTMLNQFKQSMAGPDWEIEDYEWYDQLNIVPSSGETFTALIILNALACCCICCFCVNIWKHMQFAWRAEVVTLFTLKRHENHVHCLVLRQSYTGPGQLSPPPSS